MCGVKYGLSYKDQARPRAWSGRATIIPYRATGLKARAMEYKRTRHTNKVYFCTREFTIVNLRMLRFERPICVLAALR